MPPTLAEMGIDKKTSSLAQRSEVSRYYRRCLDISGRRCLDVTGWVSVDDAIWVTRISGLTVLPPQEVYHGRFTVIAAAT